MHVLQNVTLKYQYLIERGNFSWIVWTIIPIDINIGH